MKRSYCRVVGWQLSKSLRTDLALDALEMGLWDRARAGGDTSGEIQLSDKGVLARTPRCATPSAWPKRVPSLRSARPVTACQPANQGSSGR